MFHEVSMVDDRSAARLVIRIGFRVLGALRFRFMSLTV